MSTNPHQHQDNRRRQREDSSSSPSRQQPHHVMTQPVFLQKIFPYAVTPMKSTAALFNAVSTSWSETIHHYSGAFICWRAAIKRKDQSGNHMWSKLIDWIQNPKRFVYDNDGNEINVAVLCVWIVPSLIDTIRHLPRKAEIYISCFDARCISTLYQFRELPIELFESIFELIKHVKGEYTLQQILQNVRPYAVLCDSLTNVNHFLGRLHFFGGRWVDSFFPRNGDDVSSGPVDLYTAIPCMTSPEIFQIVIDKCAALNPPHFLKYFLSCQINMPTRLLHQTNITSFYEPFVTVTILQYAIQRETLAAEFTSIIIEAIKSVDDQRKTMMKALLGVDNRSSHQNALLFACVSQRCTPELLNVLFDAIEGCAGKEGLARQFRMKGTFNNTSALNKSALVLSSQQGSAACVQTIIDKCRELGGNQFVKEQLELKSGNCDYAFIHSFYTGLAYGGRPFDLAKVECFISAMQLIGRDFLKQQLHLVGPDGRNVFLTLCSKTRENIEFILRVFKDNNFSSDEIAAHFELRDKDKMNVLMIAACNLYSDKVKPKLDLLVDELTRIQFRNSTSRNASTGSSSLLHQLLSERCSLHGMTALMYALHFQSRSIFLLETVKTLIDLFRDSSPLKNEDGVVSDEELGKHLLSVHPHLKNRLTSAFHLACAWSSSCEVFDFLLGIYENFTERKTSLRKLFAMKSVAGRTPCTALQRLLRNSNMNPETKAKCAQKIAKYLVEFGLFTGQYNQLKSHRKEELKELGVDHRLPVHALLAREKKAHGETKQAHNETKRKLDDALRKLEALSSKKN